MIALRLPLRLWFAAMLAAAVLALTGAAQAEQRPVAATKGFAIGGYDAVAYFTEGTAVEGRPEHALRWRGAIWLFSRPETLMAFEMNPRAYAPRFGGYCAVALSEGRLAAGDPRVFAIEGGRLYLAHSAALMARWKAETAARIVAAEGHWPAILGR